MSGPGTLTGAAGGNAALAAAMEGVGSFAGPLVGAGALAADVALAGVLAMQMAPRRLPCPEMHGFVRDPVRSREALHPNWTVALAGHADDVESKLDPATNGEQHHQH